MKLYLFLDFDGVMHPQPYLEYTFCQLPLVEEILREFPSVNIVISSSWRAQFDLIMWPPVPTCWISAGLKMLTHFNKKWIANGCQPSMRRRLPRTYAKAQTIQADKKIAD